MTAKNTISVLIVWIRFYAQESHRNQELLDGLSEMRQFLRDQLEMHDGGIIYKGGLLIMTLGKSKQSGGQGSEKVNKETCGDFCVKGLETRRQRCD